MHEHRTTFLEAPVPFELQAVALSHGWHECSPVTWSQGGRSLQIVERERDRAFRVSVSQESGTSKSIRLRIRIEEDGLDDAALDRVRDRVRRMLSLDVDLREFYELCSSHPTLHLIPKIGAGRILRSPTMTENVVKFLCSTNVNWSQAVKMINRLGQLGPAVRHFVHLNAWPTPTEILRAGSDYLKNVCRVGYRDESILKFCCDVQKKRFDAESLWDEATAADVDSDTLLARLRSIRGIGPSTAHALLTFLGHYDRLSIDSATLAHVARTHTRGKKPTPKQVERIYAPYGRWKNKVYWFEHWLTWGTAKRLLREGGLDGAAERGSFQQHVD